MLATEIVHFFIPFPKPWFLTRLDFNHRTKLFFFSIAVFVVGVNPTNLKFRRESLMAYLALIRRLDASISMLLISWWWKTVSLKFGTKSLMFCLSPKFQTSEYLLFHTSDFLLVKNNKLEIFWNKIAHVVLLSYQTSEYFLRFSRDFSPVEFCEHQRCRQIAHMSPLSDAQTFQQRVFHQFLVPLHVCVFM